MSEKDERANKHEFEITDPLILDAFKKWDADESNPVGIPENLSGYESTFEAGFRAGRDAANHAGGWVEISAHNISVKKWDHDGEKAVVVARLNHEVDSLPAEPGLYLWRRRTWECDQFTLAHFPGVGEPRQWWIETFTHYQKIESPEGETK